MLTSLLLGLGLGFGAPAIPPAAVTDVRELRLVAGGQPPAGPSKPASPPALAHAQQARARTITRFERFVAVIVSVPAVVPLPALYTLDVARQTRPLRASASSLTQRGPPPRA